MNQACGKTGNLSYMPFLKQRWCFMPKKTFEVNNDFDINDLTTKMVEYLQVKMKLTSAYDGIDGGFRIQTRQPLGLKSISGMSVKADILLVLKQNTLTVNVDVDQELLKKGFALVKMFVFPPLVVTDLAGSVKQLSFPNGIFKLVHKYIQSDGKDSLYT